MDCETPASSLPAALKFEQLPKKLRIQLSADMQHEQRLAVRVASPLWRNFQQGQIEINNESLVWILEAVKKEQCHLSFRYCYLNTFNTDNGQVVELFEKIGRNVVHLSVDGDLYFVKIKQHFLNIRSLHICPSRAIREEFHLLDLRDFPQLNKIKVEEDLIKYAGSIFYGQLTTEKLAAIKLVKLSTYLRVTTVEACELLLRAHAETLSTLMLSVYAGVTLNPRTWRPLIARLINLENCDLGGDIEFISLILRNLPVDVTLAELYLNCYPGFTLKALKRITSEWKKPPKNVLFRTTEINAEGQRYLSTLSGYKLSKIDKGELIRLELK